MPTEDVARPTGSVAVEENTDELTHGEAPFRDAENSHSKPSADHLTLLREASETSTREIDDLINEPEILREKLRTDANCIQQDILRHAELSRHVMRLTAIVSESPGKIPGAPDITPG